MKTYILFFTNSTITREEIETTLTPNLITTQHIFALKYFIDRDETNILIFKSDCNKDELNKILQSSFKELNVKNYYLFLKRSLILHNFLPEVENMLNKRIPNESVLFIEVYNKEEKLIMDDILDKIEKHGIDSLTKNEKNFLDNFKK